MAVGAITAAAAAPEPGCDPVTSPIVESQQYTAAVLQRSRMFEPHTSERSTRGRISSERADGNGARCAAGDTEICETYPGMDEDLYVAAEAEAFVK